MLPSFDPVRACILAAAIVAVDLRTALRMHGAGGTATRAVRHLRDLLKLGRAHRTAENTPDAFDEAHGVHTRVAMNLRELYAEKRRGGEEHTATPADVLRTLLASLDIAFEETVLVDFGSGAGRAVLVAAERPFKAIVGVEISASLHRRAEANLVSYRNPLQRCHDIRLHCGDAVQFPLPEDPLVLYFYNPFRVDVMRRVLHNIERSLAAAPRPIIAIHLWPRGDTRELFAASRFLIPVDAGPDIAMYRTRRPH
jgi:SAM-dependent methyltransferase